MGVAFSSIAARFSQHPRTLEDGSMKLVILHVTAWIVWAQMLSPLGCSVGYCSPGGASHQQLLPRSEKKTRWGMDNRHLFKLVLMFRQWQRCACRPQPGNEFKYGWCQGRARPQGCGFRGAHPGTTGLLSVRRCCSRTKQFANGMPIQWSTHRDA